MKLISIQENLEPDFIRELPTLDAWGKSYLYWTDGYQYMIASAGEDGELDRSYETVLEETREATPFFEAICSGATGSINEDVVFAGGFFCQWSKHNLDRHSLN